ncbi:alpha/beta hydrolase [Streptomyces sp. NPDC059166]|uniref:alpha/beta hydrolase n=1 Tax=Streptomyces sp. NPDC059166 TaxID=3346752 RepID=UPI00367E1D3E
MTTFILVSGMFTGPHVWDGTAARLAEAGADVHAVALSGLGGATDASGAAGVVDLETHVADVVAAIDGAARTAAGGIVLVGHDYGIHPVVGAADRRAGSVARIVYLDSGLPQDGVPALAAVADQGLRESVLRSAAEGDQGAVLPPPSRGEWRLWGSTADVPAAEIDRLTERARPQPLGTLLQPLRLTGAADGLPRSGVLCVGNGASIALVQARVNLGEPTLLPLLDAGWAFLELPTGHWPMLSAPAALADALLRASAGEGIRLTAPDAARPPAHLGPFPIDVPEVPRERTTNIDLYVPCAARGPHPAVVFVHGGPVPAEARPTPRDWPVLQGYARAVAGRGVVGAILDHRLHSLNDYERAAADVADAVERVRADPRVDSDRVALWFFSGSGPLTADWMGKPPGWLRCLAVNYPIMAALPNWGRIGDRFRTSDAVARAGTLPLVLVRAGLESAEIAATVEEFEQAAAACGAALDVIDVPNGHHGFETVDLTEESREAVRGALRAVLSHLTT